MVIGAANALVMVKRGRLASTPRCTSKSYRFRVLWLYITWAGLTTVGLESRLVGEDLNGCAFVYCSLSFLDKIFCGIALFALESYEGK
ncbi:hypothetical protein Zm00014a_010407 [Zea mays]|jgi:hypothetical protein|uniref:Uncharacterized protein n=2 Tax=Zea mays TaxID=4577 RepID=A0A8J8XHU9_MAIZE|nr:Major facilitator superfamily protein [Zea mays]PWZ57708.1 hypothetical protein Zm00014a_010407 [Zea mays]